MNIHLEELHAAQQPNWDPERMAPVRAVLEQTEPLISSAEIDFLSAELAEVAKGEAFLWQQGTCAESLSDTADTARDLFRNEMLPATVVLAYRAHTRVKKLARIAGQFAKPRSKDTETIDDITLPSFRGEMVNSPEFSKEARTPDPDRLILAHQHSRRTLKVMRQMAKTGFADLDTIHEWDVRFSETGNEKEEFRALSDGITDVLEFMKACGIDTSSIPELHEAPAFTSHEGLIMDYEVPLIRVDDHGELYASSAHSLWIGDRTRGLEDAHVALAAAIKNPIGVKIGPSATPEEVLRLCEVLNPDRIPGRLTLISRMGKDQIGAKLPPLVGAVREARHSVIWTGDPMHGNTINTKTGQKTRRFADIKSETESFFGILKDEGTRPGGMHLEATPEDVTECLGGSEPNEVTDLSSNYKTTCDPRLNPSQSFELAVFVAGKLAELRKSSGKLALK